MDDEPFLRLIKTGDPQEVIRGLSGKNEKERGSLSRLAIDWLTVCQAKMTEKAWAGFLVFGGTGDLPREARKAKEVLESYRSGAMALPAQCEDPKTAEAARVALLATANLTAIKRFRRPGLPLPDNAYLVLSDRKPRFLAGWLEFALESSPLSYYPVASRLEADKLVNCRPSTAYLQGMIATLGGDEAALVEKLSDPAFLAERLWPLFDDSAAVSRLTYPVFEDSFRNFDFNVLGAQAFDWQAQVRESNLITEASKVWKRALSSGAGKSPELRARLIDTLVTVLTRISADSENRKRNSVIDLESSISWITSLIDACGLSADERREYLPRFIGLLATRDWEALTWTIGKIEECSDQGLPVDDICANIGSVLANKRTEPARQALKLLSRIARSDGASLPAVARAAVDALEHKSPEIRKTALDLLEKTEALQVPEIASLLNDRAQFLSGLERERACSLLQSYDLLDRPVSAAGFDEEEEKAILERAGHLPADLAKLAGIEHAIKAVKGDLPFAPAINLLSMDFPRLSEKNKLEPIKSIDDLVYHLSSILSGRANSDELELGLEGIARLCSEQPPDMKERTAALEKRLKDIPPEPFHIWAWSNAPGATTTMAGLIKSWLDGSKQDSKPGKLLLDSLNSIGSRIKEIGLLERVTPGATSTEYVFADRANHVASSAARRESLEILATPTHRGGWIDPLTFVERYERLQTEGSRPNKVDFIQALLRLAPDGRPEALKKLGKITSEYDAALVYALGADTTVAQTERLMKTSSLWVAAARCRSPYGDDPMVDARFPGTGPDGAIAARYEESFDEMERLQRMGLSFSGDGYEITRIMRTAPAAEKSAPVEMPTVLIHISKSFLASNNAVWPQNRESYFATEIRRMAVFHQSNSDFWLGSWAEPLFDPDVHTAGNGRILIALGLCAKNQDLARLALDALITSVDDGRLDGIVFGEALGTLSKTGQIVKSRWAKALKEMSSISPLHGQFVNLAIQRLMAHLPRADARASTDLIELLFDLLDHSGDCLTDEGARLYLESIPGSGKKAKLARAICQKTKNSENPYRKEAALAALQSRIARVENWQSRLTEA